VRRDPALVPLSHDHHHALVAARRLRTSGDADAFLRFFETESVRHFRDEEERLFPLVAGSEEARPAVVRALLEHQRLHALAARLRDGEPVAADAADALEAHVRFEERELFPLLERLLAERLAAVDVREPPLRGRGPEWGLESDDLNATLLTWSAGEGPPEHVNEERDVLVFVVAGSAELALDGETSVLAAGEATIVAKGRRRRLTAGPDGVRYLSAHLRRPPLQIRPR
jgi:quercetin dioxygenase-like cupin family protein